MFRNVIQKQETVKKRSKHISLLRTVFLPWPSKWKVPYTFYRRYIFWEEKTRKKAL